MIYSQLVMKILLLVLISSHITTMVRSGQHNDVQYMHTSSSRIVMSTHSIFIFNTVILVNLLIQDKFYKFMLYI
jgi:hypothetical protein